MEWVEKVHTNRTKGHVDHFSHTYQILSSRVDPFYCYRPLCSQKCPVPIMVCRTLRVLVGERGGLFLNRPGFTVITTPIL